MQRCLSGFTLEIKKGQSASLNKKTHKMRKIIFKKIRFAKLMLPKVRFDNKPTNCLTKFSQKYQNLTKKIQDFGISVFFLI